MYRAGAQHPRAVNDMVMEKRNWEKVHKFELRHKRAALRRLSARQSMAIFADLYEFGQQARGKHGYLALNREKIRAIQRVRALMQKAA